MSRRGVLLPLALLLALALSIPGKAAPSAQQETLPEVVAAPFIFERSLPSSPAVGTDWFSGAVFIGDVRLQELTEAGLFQPGLSLSQVGLNLRDLRWGTPFSRNGVRTSLRQMLEGCSCRRVYLLLGFNEASWMGEEEFYEEYSGLIDDLRRLLPGAEVYVQTLIPVTVSRAAARTPGNELLARYNTLLTRLTRDKRVYLVDVAGYFTGAGGALTPALSTDGLHLTAEGNAQWFQYLRTHTMGI